MPPKKIDKRKKKQTPQPPTPPDVKKIKIAGSFVPKGELNATQIRELILAHNKLMKIDIPKGTKRDGLIKIIRDNGYKIDHVAKKLIPDVAMKRKPVVKMPPPKPKKTPMEKEAIRQSNIKKKVSKAKEVLAKHDPSYKGAKPSKDEVIHSRKVVSKWGPFKKGVSVGQANGSSPPSKPSKPSSAPKPDSKGVKKIKPIKKGAKPKVFKKIIKLPAGVSPKDKKKVVDKNSNAIDNLLDKLKQPDKKNKSPNIKIQILEANQNSPQLTPAQNNVIDNVLNQLINMSPHGSLQIKSLTPTPPKKTPKPKSKESSSIHSSAAYSSSQPSGTPMGSYYREQMREHPEDYRQHPLKRQSEKDELAQLLGEGSGSGGSGSGGTATSSSEADSGGDALMPLPDDPGGSLLDEPQAVDPGPKPSAKELKEKNDMQGKIYSEAVCETAPEGLKKMDLNKINYKQPDLWTYNDDKAGRTIKLTKRSHIDSGGFGSVSKVSDSTGKYAVAVKQLFQPQNDPEIDYVKQQIDPLKNCNVVGARYMGRTRLPNTHIPALQETLVMDLATGSLTDLMGKFDAKHLMEATKQIAIILECFVKNGYAYNDLKAQNFLFRCEDKKHLKIFAGDIGSLCKLGSKGIASFPAIDVAGKPGQYPPCTESSTVWALGVTIAQLLGYGWFHGNMWHRYIYNSSVSAVEGRVKGFVNKAIMKGGLNSAKYKLKGNGKYKTFGEVLSACFIRSPSERAKLSEIIKSIGMVGGCSK